MSDTMSPTNALFGLPALTGGAEPAEVPETAPALEAEGLDPGQPDAGPDMKHARMLMGWIKSPNISVDLDEDERQTIAARVKRDYDLDETSRGEWKTAYQEWLDLAMQVADAKNYPWPNASNVLYPLLTTAAIQFQARAYPAIIRDRNVVKGTVVGDDNGTPALGPDGQPMVVPGPDGQPQPQWQMPPGEKRRRADQIGQHMSWQLLDEQQEWEPQTDRMLLLLPIVGTVFRKSYFDPATGRNVSETVDALRMCVNYDARSFEDSPRKTEIIDLYPHQIEERIRAGLWLDEEYGHNDGAGEDEDAPVTFLEQHRRWDLDEDGYPEPYIITIAKDSGRLARIVAAYDEETVHFSGRDHKIRRIDPVAYYTKFGFIPNPGSTVYDIGFGHLLQPINDAVNTTLNQMFDAGHLANAGGGFIGTGLSINTGSVRFQIGEYKPVNTSGMPIRDSVFPIPFPGPNPVLYQLLVFLVESAKEIAAVKDVLMGDLPAANTPATTTLAVIEQGLRVFSAIHQRIHRALKAEFTKLFRLNRLYLPLEAGYQVGSEWRGITQEDYAAGAGVEPVSDPRMVTDMQRLARAQFLMGFNGDPMINQMEIRRRVLDAAQIDNISALIVANPPPDQQLEAVKAQLRLEGLDLQVRKHELDIRAAHQEGELRIRRGKDKAQEIESLSRAILNLANAAKADAAADQGWYATHIALLKAQADALNADDGDDSDNPAAAAGLKRPAVPAGPEGDGPSPGGMGGVAQPPGDAAVPGMDGGLGGYAGAGGSGAMAPGQ